ncbi:MAG TPA: histidine kinase dimerization/phospho-acceptor domain-containing protein, partial [Gaiellaceae bacterium]|nr:histidine kinase dimerization/phospho-acceptor domain-containing protein [Gaiellaceae bacterium]
MVPGGRGRHWLERHRQGVVYALIAVVLVVAIVAATVGGLRLHHAVLVERQTLRTQQLDAAVLELQMDAGNPHRLQRARAAADAAFANLAAHDPAEGRRLHAAYAAYVQAPSSQQHLNTLESGIQAEAAGEARQTRVANPAARAALIVAAVLAALLVALLAWQFELARRAGRIDRDHAARAEELIRLRDEFVAVISHELRTPMTSIIGYL